MLILLAIGTNVKVGLIIIVIALLGYNVLFGDRRSNGSFSNGLRSYDITEYRQDGSELSYTKSYRRAPTVDELNRGRFGGSRVISLTCTESYVSSSMKRHIRNEGKR